MVFCTRGVIVLVCQRGSGDSLFKCTDKLRSGRTSRGNRHAESSPNAYNRAIGTGQVHERDGTIRMTTDKFEPRIEDTVVERLLANHRRFLDFLTARVGKREDAEEILQDAFVRGIQKAGEIRDEENAVAWFYRLLRNAVIDHYRHIAAGRKALEVQARETPEVDPGVDAELERTVCECVNDLVPLLKPEYSDLIRRVDLEGANVTSVADEIGISAGNARVRLHRARASLRDELEKFCRTCATHGCIDCTCSRTEPAA